jgi:hypothetical protein
MDGWVTLSGVDGFLEHGDSSPRTEACSGDSSPRSVDSSPRSVDSSLTFEAVWDEGWHRVQPVLQLAQGQPRARVAVSRVHSLSPKRQTPRETRETRKMGSLWDPTASGGVCTATATTLAPISQAPLFASAAPRWCTGTLHGKVGVNGLVPDLRRHVGRSLGASASVPGPPTVQPVHLFGSLRKVCGLLDDRLWHSAVSKSVNSMI